MRMSLHKLYINTLMYMYTYFRCKNPFINLGMKRCNGHCSVGPASLPIGQVHGGSLFVTDAGGVWAWGVEMWKVWKTMDLNDSRLKRLDASHDSQYTYIYIWYSIHIHVMVREEEVPWNDHCQFWVMSKSWGNWPFYIAYGLLSSRKKAKTNRVINACCVLFIIWKKHTQMVTVSVVTSQRRKSSIKNIIFSPESRLSTKDILVGWFL